MNKFTILSILLILLSCSHDGSNTTKSKEKKEKSNFYSKTDELLIKMKQTEDSLIKSNHITLKKSEIKKIALTYINYYFNDSSNKITKIDSSLIRVPGKFTKIQAADNFYHCFDTTEYGYFIDVTEACFRSWYQQPNYDLSKYPKSTEIDLNTESEMKWGKIINKKYHWPNASFELFFETKQAPLTPETYGNGINDFLTDIETIKIMILKGPLYNADSTFIDDDGILRSRNSNKKVTGVEYEWWGNGNLKSETYYFKGLQQGYYRFWNDYGKLFQEVLYDDGVVISEKCFDDDKKNIPCEEETYLEEGCIH